MKAHYECRRDVRSCRRLGICTETSCSGDLLRFVVFCRVALEVLGTGQNTVIICKDIEKYRNVKSLWN